MRFINVPTRFRTVSTWLFLAVAAQAQLIITEDTVIDFATGGVIVQANSDGVSPTATLVAGGSISTNFIAFDSSTIRVYGGSVGDELATWDTSRAIFLSGEVDEIDSNGNSVVYHFGGDVDETFDADDFSTGYIFGGEVEEGVRAFDASTIYILSGFLEEGVRAFGNSTVHIFGGINLFPWDTENNGTIHVYGADLALADFVDPNFYSLTGTYADGSSFSQIIQKADNIILHEFTLEDRFALLMLQVNVLLGGDLLSDPTARSLLAGLEAAAGASEGGHLRAAKRLLNAFAHRIDSLLSNGRLTEAQGGTIADTAAVLISLLGQ